MRTRLIFCVLLLLLAATAAQEPVAVPPQGKPATPAEVSAPAATTPVSPQRKQFQDDTARLLQLATDLKQQVDRSNEGVLSLGMMRKAEAIEKLTHEMRGRARGQQ